MGLLLLPVLAAGAAPDAWQVVDQVHDVEVYGTWVLAPVPSVDIAAAAFEAREGGLGGASLQVVDLARTGPEDDLFARRAYTVRQWVTVAFVDPENLVFVVNFAARIEPAWLGHTWLAASTMSQAVNGVPEVRFLPGNLSIDEARGELRWTYDAPVAAPPVQVDAASELIGCDDVGGALSCGPLERVPTLGEAPAAGGVVSADRAGPGARREATLPDGLRWSDLFPAEGGPPEALLEALDGVA